MNKNSNEPKLIENKLSLKIKFLLLGLTLSLGFCLFWINYISNPINTFSMIHYSYSDYPSVNYPEHVSAYGSWLSTDTELAVPLQTIDLNCWEEWNLCIIATAEFDPKFNNFLIANTHSYTISKWTNDYIETVPQEMWSGCIENVMRIDRRAKVVSMTRRTINNTDGFCTVIQDEPITMTLGDGEKRLSQARQQRGFFSFLKPY